MSHRKENPCDGFSLYEELKKGRITVEEVNEFVIRLSEEY